MMNLSVAIKMAYKKKIAGWRLYLLLLMISSATFLTYTTVISFVSIIIFLNFSILNSLFVLIELKAKSAFY